MCLLDLFYYFLKSYFHLHLGSYLISQLCHYPPFKLWCQVNISKCLCHVPVQEHTIAPWCHSEKFNLFSLVVESGPSWPHFHYSSYTYYSQRVLSFVEQTTFIQWQIACLTWNVESEDLALGPHSFVCKLMFLS